jgi:hypothetical protein
MKLSRPIQVPLLQLTTAFEQRISNHQIKKATGLRPAPTIHGVMLIRMIHANLKI